MKLEDFNIIEADWWWGKSINLISKDALGVITIKFDNDNPNTAFFSNLLVHPDARRKGYGFNLLYYAEYIAMEHDKLYVQLSVHRATNWLVEWYLRLNYNIFEVDECEYTMLKVLGK